MKTLTPLIIAALLFGFTQSAQCQFSLHADRETVSINPGETAIFNISITPENGFDASIFLELSMGKLHLTGGNGSLSASIINAPYLGLTLTVKTTANYTDGGLYEFRILGKNGLVTSTVICYVNIIPTPRTNWRVIKEYRLPNFIIQDDAGSYWLGSGDSRIATVDSRIPIEQWRDKAITGFEATSIPPILDSKNNKIWLSTYKGLERYSLDGNNQTIYNTNNSLLPYNSITALAKDNTTDAIWIATYYGLARLDGTEWTVFDSASTNSVLGKEEITSLIVSNGTVWIGTTNGLVKYDGKIWTRFTPQNSEIPARLARVMAVETNGDVWVGLSNDWNAGNYGETYSMIGVAKFNGAAWTLYNKQNSPIGENNYINSVAIDKKGNKWMATASHRLGSHESFVRGAGILKFDNTEWTAYTKDNSSIPDNNINWLGIDNNDNVWFHQLIDEDFPSGILSFWGVFNENGLPFLLAPSNVEEQPEVTDGIALYPNPTNTSFTINGADNILSVKLMNSLGMEVSRKSSVVSGKAEVDVADLASGVYFVQLRTPTGMITKSIIVSR